MVITDSVTNFSMGRVINRTFAVLSRNLVTFLIVAAVVMIPVMAVDLFVGTPNYVLASHTKGVAFGLLAAIVPIICTYLLQAALVQGTITDLNGERPDLGRALSTGFSLLLPVAAIAVLSLLGMIVGMIVVVPGLMLAAGWSVAVPVKVVEGTSIMGSLDRSWELTRGYRWKIFGLILIYFLAIILLALAVEAIAGVSFAAEEEALNNVPYIVLEWLRSVITAVLTAIGVTAIYYELRSVKEGMAPQELAAAFD